MRASHGLTLFLLLLVSSRVAFADAVDDYIKTEMEKSRIPGLSLAVIKDGKILKASGYGSANLETGTPATPETVYKIGSVSKQFIATGIMILLQDGKLRLEDPISMYLEGTPESWKPITIRHLLTHTSGIVREAPGFDPFKIQADAAVIKTAYPLPLRFAPGEKWEYCNVGYFALSEVIHKITGKPWGDFLTERVFKPAGMTTTRTTTTTDLIPHRASGYELTSANGELKNAENWVALRPSGAFISTVLDMAKWDAVLDSNTILSEASREQMWTPVKLNDGTTYAYGFGWTLSPWQGHKQVSHNGALPGFRSVYRRFVDDKLSVVVLTNTAGIDPGPISLAVAGFYVPALAPRRATVTGGRQGEPLDSVRMLSLEMNTCIDDCRYTVADDRSCVWFTDTVPGSYATCLLGSYDSNALFPMISE